MLNLIGSVDMIETGIEFQVLSRAGEAELLSRTLFQEVLAMAEVGLVRFAGVAHEIASTAVPQYRTKRSKHIFTQPQLLAVLLLMRFEDWTFREAEVRLLEHSELRAALGLERVPDHTALYKFMRRLDEKTLDACVEEAARRMPAPPSGGSGDAGGGAVVAVDGTGLASCAVSLYFVKRTKGQRRRSYLKWVIAIDVEKFVVTSQMACEGPRSDSASLPSLVGAALRLGPVGAVLADAEFDSHSNHYYIREEAGAVSVIKAGRGRPGDGAHGARAEMRDAFPKQLYGRRSLVEAAFSAIKRKLSARAPGHTPRSRQLQALLLGAAFNIYRLKPFICTRRHSLATEPAMPQ